MFRKLKRGLVFLYRNSCNFSCIIPLVTLLWHVRNYVPSSIYNKMVQKKHEEVERYIVELLSPELDVLCNEFHDCKEDDANPVIWVCWLQGEEGLPDIPKVCLEKIYVHAAGHPVRFVSLENYTKYVNIPEFVATLFKEGKISMPHFSDILRTALLYYHGGCWIDATILLTDDLPGDLFAKPFYSIRTEKWGDFITQCRWSNFFMASWKRNPLMGITLKMFYLYMQKVDCFVDYFMMDYFMDIVYRRNAFVKEMIDQIPYNNPNVHSMCKVLNEKFSDEICEKIKSGNTFIHKLQWKGAFSEKDVNGFPTFYAYLLKRKL